MLGLRKHDIFWFLSFFCLVAVSLGFVTTIFGKGYGVKVSTDPAGGHVISHGINKEAYLSVHWFRGVLPVNYHKRLLESPWFIPFDVFGSPADGANPANFGIRIRNWFAAALFTLCAWWSWRKYLKPRGNPHCCPICNYDLRAHKPGQKCPECGTEIPRFGWRSKKGDR